MSNQTLVGASIFGLAFAAIMGLSAVFGSFYTVDDGEVAVVDTFGKYDDDESKPGLHWKMPFIQGVTFQDVRMQTVNYKYNPNGYGQTDSGVFVQPRISILDSKNLPIGIDITMQFTPDATQMSDILRTYGANYLEKKLNPIVRDVVRDVASGYEAENIARKRGEIGEQMKVKLSEEFAKLPFELNEVAIRAIDLPPSVAEKVRQVQEAKQEEQRLAMVEKQAIVNKKIAVIDAEKKAEVARTEAQGKADAILAVAIAQAKANKKVAASLTSLLVQQNQIEKWSGTVPQTVLGDSSNVLMSIK